MKRKKTKTRKASTDVVPYAGPRSPLRVMQIVETLAESGKGLSLVALAKYLSIPKTSLFSHLRVLVGTGHVAIEDARYTLGPASIRLGAVIGSGYGALESISVVARRLAAQSGETTLVAILDEAAREAVYLQVLEGHQPIRYSPAVGTRRPLYCTAMGRALLAAQDEDWVRRYLVGAKFVRFNARTVTDRAKLSRVLAQVAKQRLAVTVAEHTEGVGAVASPVFDRQGHARYALGLAVPSGRLLTDLQRLSKLVRVAAEDASWAHGARAPAPTNTPAALSTALSPGRERTSQ